jgi:hypothetical protein
MKVGIPIVGVIIGMLLVAAGATALPTKLCKLKLAACAKAETWTLSGAAEDFEVAVKEKVGVKLEMGTFLTVSCNGGKLGFALSEGAGPLTGEVSKWNFAGCTPGCVIATPKSEATGYTASMEATGGGNGTIVIANTPVLEAKCTGGPTCVYKATSISLPFQGGTFETASVLPNVKLSKDFFKSNFACPESATYSGSYFVVAPGTPVYATN